MIERWGQGLLTILLGGAAWWYGVTHRTPPLSISTLVSISPMPIAPADTALLAGFIAAAIALTATGVTQIGGNAVAVYVKYREARDKSLAGKLADTETMLREIKTEVAECNARHIQDKASIADLHKIVHSMQLDFRKTLDTLQSQPSNGEILA